MNRRERDAVQLVVNSMGDVLRVGWAPSIHPRDLVKAWADNLDALLVTEGPQLTKEEIDNWRWCDEQQGKSTRQPPQTPDPDEEGGS